MDARIIIETAAGADVAELRLTAELADKVTHITFIRGGEVFRLDTHHRPIISSATPRPDMIHIPSPARSPELREGWTCPNAGCSVNVDVDRDRCPWCKTPRPSAE